MRWVGPHPPTPSPKLGEGESPGCPLGVTGVRARINHVALSYGAGEDLMRHHLLVERIPTIVNKHLVRVMPAKVPHSIRKGRTSGPPEQPIDEISIKGTSIVRRKPWYHNVWWPLCTYQPSR